MGVEEVCECKCSCRGVCVLVGSACGLVRLPAVAGAKSKLLMLVVVVSSGLVCGGLGVIAARCLGCSGAWRVR